MCALFKEDANSLDSRQSFLDPGVVAFFLPPSVCQVSKLRLQLGASGCLGMPIEKNGPVEIDDLPSYFSHGDFP